MTVCIAAICKEGLVCVADRQGTNSSNGFKSTLPHPKILQLHERIFALIADDMSLQMELIQETLNKSLNRDETSPITVKEVVAHYRDAYAEKCQEDFEMTVLVKQGLTYKTFFEKQRNGELSKTFIDFIAQALKDHPMPYGTETIIAGKDRSGTHIYRIDNGKVTLQSAKGYAVIGNGWDIAESQFALAKFNKRWSDTEVGFLSYVAKKRAETIEGVGNETDVRLVLKSGIVFLNEWGLNAFQEKYLELEREIEESEKKARGEIREILETAVKQSREKRENEGEVGETDQPNNSNFVRGGTKEG